MAKYKKTIYIFIIVMSIISSCRTKEIIQHPSNIPINDLNNSLKLLAPPEWNSFKLNKSVDLEIVNESKRRISFNKYFGKKIFVIQNNQFTEIENQIVVIGNQDSTILESDTSTGTVFRVILDKNQKELIRVYVIGKFLDTSESVTAYLDVMLTP
ncbi:MAG: hypothetical protein U0Z26_04860 [Anaerolineales bacterium]